MSKVFAIGDNKTGTSSLQAALKYLGYNLCPEKPFYIKDNPYFNLTFQKNWEPILKFTKDYDAFQDKPWNVGDFYKVLYEHFPTAKFILTYRDADDWFDSYVTWGKLTALNRRWFYRTLSLTSYGVDDFLRVPEHSKDVFLKRNSDVVEYFKNSDNFLSLHIKEENKWEKLCNFLAKPIPNIDFPHEKRTR